jgi:glycosyltransferase involved in cell wall biosynthesis
MSASHGPVGARVSVILPVYNAADVLADCLRSLEAQDLPEDELEIIAIDDGATDGSGRMLDEFAAGHALRHVVHQPNAGWPGGPRNRGLERSTGGYVFFLDADDWLDPGALRAMRDYAVAHSVDVVVPRLTAVGGANDYAEFAGITDPAGVREAFTYLTPQKLIRRSLLETHGIRFVEGKVRLEDAIFITEVYLKAGHIVLLGDRPYYNKRRRADKRNLTFQQSPIEEYFASVRAVARTISEHCDDPDLAADLLLVLYRKKALWRLRPDKLTTYRRRRRREWVEHISAFAEEYVSPELQRRLPLLPRMRSEFARRKDVKALMMLARVVRAGEQLKIAAQDDGRVLWQAPDGRQLDVTDIV